MNQEFNFDEFEEFEDLEGPEDFKHLDDYKYSSEWNHYNVTCKLANLSDQSYNKVEKTTAEQTIYMEYDTIYE